MAATSVLHALHLSSTFSDFWCNAKVSSLQESSSSQRSRLEVSRKVLSGRDDGRTRSTICKLASSKFGEGDDLLIDTMDQGPGSKSRKAKYTVAASVGSSTAVVQERSATQNGSLLGVLVQPTEVEKPSTGDTIKIGGLIDGGLVYREKFVIRCYEVGTNRTASMEAMANLLQECACNHAQSVGFSTDGFATTPAMRKRHLIWVTTRMHIDIDEYPVWGQVIEIDTWFQGEAKIATRRDWLIRHEDGRIIGRATSVWVMMNTDTRRLCRIPDDVRAEYMDFVPLPPRWAIPGDDTTAVKKIGALDQYEYVRSPLLARRSDLDMNQHVNNVTYMGWMLESMPLEVAETHELKSITLDYKRECKHDDVVESMTSREAVEEELTGSQINGTAVRKSVDTPEQFTHLLRLVNCGTEINRGRTEWRKKVARQSSH
ncbi:hypothetical protein R1sor_015314 [Riccia sorocarpa]|uniref:Acyl-[acyl-carrier-protein] hydrolase n=1 Tax=Riccia sorocarpa TaxID=122646 RepID=A0ABD3HF74_9MARC